MQEVNFEKLNLTYPKPILIKDLGMMFPTENSKKKARYGIYKCGFCGNKFRADTTNIKNSHTKSCGCHKKRRTKEVNTKHGLIGTKLYMIWSSIKNRTLNPNHKQYNNYGGRGITLCDEWLDVHNFYDWAMSNGYSDELSIDRIDNDEGYSPENCRWVNSSIQNRNRRIQKNNTSGFKGVHLNKKTNKYVSCIKVNKIHYHLGSFSTAVEGAIVYNNYIIENSLEGFILNEIPERI